MVNTSMVKNVKKIVIVGGGTAGWMSAALINKVLGNAIELILVESEDIGTIGVGEATIPPIQHVNAVLRIDEAEFLRETQATIKLAIKFENWRVNGEGYFHTFGAAGQATAFGGFHDFWLRAKRLGITSNLWDFDLNYHAAIHHKFAKFKVGDPNYALPYAYHFDATLYAKFLRKLSEARGVQRLEGNVTDADIDPVSGHITSLRLASGQEVKGDLFVDCTGFRALLIQQKLNTGYEDWGHWLPCDRALAVPSERFQNTLPYTRSIAHGTGWQWRIPLQHRNGNGLVYSSSHCTEAEAESILMKNLESSPLAEPKSISFRTGRRLKQWNRNVISVGLSSGFLEPLESTSIHLIQSAIVRLLKLFPHNGINCIDIDEYNRQSKVEFEQIRDFIILHYHVNEREDTQFWRDMRAMEIPDSLARKIELFRQNGRLFREQNDLFLESSWLQVMLGQGITPQDYHPVANTISEENLKKMMENLKAHTIAPIEKLPSHDEFLKMVCGKGRG